MKRIVLGQSGSTSAEDAALANLYGESHNAFLDGATLARHQERLERIVRDEAASSPRSPSSVYLMFDQWGTCIYVGLTKSPTSRLIGHGSDKDWFPEISEIRFEHYPTRETAARREKWLIHELDPVYNKQRSHPFAGSASKSWDILRDNMSRPAWPLLEGYAIPLTMDEQLLVVPVANPTSATLLYDVGVRTRRRTELIMAEADGRVMRAARAIARRIQDSAEQTIYIQSIFDVVDDYPFVAVAGMLRLTADDAPAIRVGPFVMERRTYAKLKRDRVLKG